VFFPGVRLGGLLCAVCGVEAELLYLLAVTSAGEGLCEPDWKKRASEYRAFTCKPLTGIKISEVQVSDKSKSQLTT
jgi:hypothetical protein